MKTNNLENKDYIGDWIKTCHNPMADVKNVREAKERLSMVNQKDYYEACERTGFRPFTEYLSVF